MPKQKSLEEVLKELQNASSTPSEWNLEKFTNEARRQIANKFVDGFFILLLLSFIVSLVYNVFMYILTGNASLFIPLKDIVLLTSSILGGPLGFIVGFYFKDK